MRTLTWHSNSIMALGGVVAIIRGIFSFKKTSASSNFLAEGSSPRFALSISSRRLSSALLSFFGRLFSAFDIGLSDSLLKVISLLSELELVLRVTPMSSRG